MDADSIKHIFTYLKENFFLYLMLVVSVTGVINPRFLWESREWGEGWKFAGDSQPGPSGCWIWATRITSFFVAAIALLFLIYGKTAPATHAN